MMTQTLKSISYAFPTSPAAEKLGFGKDGCYYVKLTLVNIEGSGQCKSIIPHDAEGFSTPDDPDLIALYNETEGKIEPCFARYGDAKALALISR